MIMVLDVTFYR